MTTVRVLAVVVSMLAGVVGAAAQAPLTMGDLFAVDSNVMGEQRRVIGHSLGGLFAMHALTTRPDLFNAIIAVSPSLPWRQGEPVTRIDTMLAHQRTMLAVNNYPDSANAYDSLGEALEAAGRLDDAPAKNEAAVRRAEAARDPLVDAFLLHRDTLRRKLAK